MRRWQAGVAAFGMGFLLAGVSQAPLGLEPPAVAQTSPPHDDPLPPDEPSPVPAGATHEPERVEPAGAPSPRGIAPPWRESFIPELRRRPEARARHLTV